MASLWRHISKLNKQRLQDLKGDGLQITRRYIGDDGREKVAPSLPIGRGVVVNISRVDHQFLTWISTSWCRVLYIESSLKGILL